MEDIKGASNIWVNQKQQNLNINIRITEYAEWVERDPKRSLRPTPVPASPSLINYLFGTIFYQSKLVWAAITQDFPTSGR